MLPSGFGPLLVAFAPLFRSSVWDYAQVLLLGAILAPGRRTVSSVFCIVGLRAGAYRRLLAPKGRMITICPDPKRPLFSFLYIFLSAVFGTRRVRFFSAKPKTKVMTDLTSYVESGAIRPILDKTYPLSDIAAAHRAFEQGGRRGKQVVRVA